MTPGGCEFRRAGPRRRPRQARAGIGLATPREAPAAAADGGTPVSCTSNPWRIYCQGVMKRSSLILLVMAFALAASATAIAKGKPRPKEGDYPLSVAGVVKGTGYATISGTKLKIQADVTDGAGRNGNIDAGNLTIRKNDFNGSGSVMGQAATFTGRIDQPSDADERALRGVRLVCTFKTADGRYGRIVGSLPPPPGGSSVDADPDRDRNKPAPPGRSVGKGREKGKSDH